MSKAKPVRMCAAAGCTKYLHWRTRGSYCKYHNAQRLGRSKRILEPTARTEAGRVLNAKPSKIEQKKEALEGLNPIGTEVFNECERQGLGFWRALAVAKVAMRVASTKL